MGQTVVYKIQEPVIKPPAHCDKLSVAPQSTDKPRWYYQPATCLVVMHFYTQLAQTSMHKWEIKNWIFNKLHPPTHNNALTAEYLAASVAEQGSISSFSLPKLLSSSNRGTRHGRGDKVPHKQAQLHPHLPSLRLQIFWVEHSVALLNNVTCSGKPTLEEKTN